MKQIVHAKVENIEYSGDSKMGRTRILTPNRLGIHFTRYIVNKKDFTANPYSCYYEVCIAEGDDKVFSYWCMDFSRRIGQKKEIPKEKLLSTKDILEVIKPLLKYLDISEECKYLSAPIIQDIDRSQEISIRREALLDGIPCRYKGLHIRVSKLDGKINGFSLTLPVIPINNRPQEKCPTGKVLSIAKEWLENKKDIIQLKEIDEQDVKLVIAPAYNFFC